MMPNAPSDEVMALYRRGEHFQRFGELNAAEESLKAAIEKDESFALAWNLLGLVYQDAEKYAEALECFNKAMDLDTKWTDPIENAGMLQYSEEMYMESIETLTSYLELGGNELDTLLALTKAAVQVNDCQTVLTVTSSILEKHEDLYEVWEMRGMCQAQLDRYNAACTSLNAAIDLNPRAISSLNAVGDLCYDAQNYARAIEFYEPSLAVKKKQPDVLFKYGTTLWLLDRWKEAIPILDMYTDLSPDDPRGWNNLGVALREKGDVKRAVECYRRALELDSALDIVKKNIETAKEMQVLL
ncbi:MAG: tetratricopeptide repeat protein [Candidatus Thorarchaeota archaeon]|jgi:tetratricopeptide (TPR) repeat protein